MMKKLRIFGVRLLLGRWILSLSAILLATRNVCASGEQSWVGLLANGQLVDVRKYDPTIVVEMRYATVHNCVSSVIYPSNLPCLTRTDTAVRLHIAETLLHNWGYRLKIWDAYRPQEAQDILYKRWAGKGFVANPDEGPGSLHTWGLAVDATMVDLLGHDVSMPSGFDVFTPDASAIYTGTNKDAAFHLHLLQGAMGAAGFMGIRNEWWHFAVKDWGTHHPLTPSSQWLGTLKPTDAPNLVTAPASSHDTHAGLPTQVSSVVPSR